MSRSAVVALVAALLVVSACGLAVADGFGHAGSTVEDESGVDATFTDGGVDQRAATGAPDEFDTTRFEVVVYENGSATWTFRHERQLETQEDREEFRTFAENFEDEETPLYVRFINQTDALINSGADYTDREMDGEGYNRSADIEYRPGAMGVVEMEFTWTNFAEDDDGTVIVGDVFEGGLYIGEGQALELVAGEDLEFREVRPEAEYPGTSLEAASSVTWPGEHEFLDGQPYAVLEDPDEAADAGANEGGSDLLAPADGSTWLVAGGLLVALGIGASVALVWYRSSGETATEEPTGATGQAGDPATNGSGTAGVGAAGGEVADSGSGPGAAGPDPIPESELMTDEDRVVSLIHENGGRMKQVNIVEETGWSKSKVSMLLSEMEDEGTVSKLRVGRENIISLEGFEPEATKSPFEE